MHAMAHLLPADHFLSKLTFAACGNGRQSQAAKMVAAGKDEPCSLWMLASGVIQYMPARNFVKHCQKHDKMGSRWQRKPVYLVMSHAQNQLFLIKDDASTQIFTVGNHMLVGRQSSGMPQHATDF